MAAFTAESQIDFEKVVSARDEKLHTDYRHKREIRKDIPEPVLDPSMSLLFRFFLFSSLSVGFSQS